MSNVASLSLLSVGIITRWEGSSLSKSPEPQIILSLPLLALEEERSRATEEWLEDETNGVERWGYIDLSLLVARNMEASEGSVVTRNSLPEKGSECSKWGEKTFNVKRGLV